METTFFFSAGIILGPVLLESTFHCLELPSHVKVSNSMFTAECGIVKTADTWKTNPFQHFSHYIVFENSCDKHVIKQNVRMLCQQSFHFIHGNSFNGMKPQSYSNAN